MEYAIFKRLSKKLLGFTKSCREDMHEPDEQGISARVVGSKLDNAFGECIREDAITDGWQEFVVILENKDYEQLQINLASLIALARVGGESLILKDFEWTDELVLEYAKRVCGGSYGEYKGFRTKEEKMKRFKILENKKRRIDV